MSIVIQRTVASLSLALGAALCLTLPPNPSHAQAATSQKPTRIRTKLDGFDIEPKSGKAQNQIGGASRGIGGLTLYAPKLGKAYTLTPTFAWSAEDESTEYSFRLSVLSAGQGPIYETKVTGGHFTYPADAPALVPGSTYVWQVTPANDMLGGTASASILIIGGDDRTAVETALHGKPALTAADARLFVEKRLWYDALAAYTSLLQAEPGNAEYRKGRAELYDQLPQLRPWQTWIAARRSTRLSLGERHMPDAGETTHSPSMQVRFWGVRGSIPTPFVENLSHGGNTPCIEVTGPTGECFIFDAGTGIRNLGIDLLKNRCPCDSLNLFLTHFHWDHLQGLPFFLPLYGKANTVTFHSARPVAQLREILRGQMATPYFPVHFDLLAAEMQFAQITGHPKNYGEVQISSFALTHPEGASGYRIATPRATIVYATDHEHGIPAADERLVQAAQNADILIYDAQFTPEEYPTHAGWGHGTWLEAVKVAQRARVKQLVLFHHDPGHDDESMENIVARARAHFPNTVAGIEGMVLNAG